MITKAVIVASRMLTDGADPGRNPRIAALQYVANRPLLHLALGDLAQLEIEEIVIAADADALLDVRECVEEFLAESDRAWRGLDYAICADAEDMQQVLAAAATFVGDEPCLFQPADGLLEAPGWMLRDQQVHSDLLLFSSSQSRDTPTDDPSGFGSDEASDETLPSRTTDIALFGPGMLRRAAQSIDGGQTLDLALLGSRMFAAGASVEVERAPGWHRYRGERRDLLELNRIALDRVVSDYPARLERSNKIVGRVQIDSSAVIRDSWIVGPAVIGPGATITDAYIGPYTSIGRDARVVGAEVERSIVSPEASVMHVGGRLISSLVGRSARVSNNFAMPRGLRLWLSDGDEIALC